MEGGGGGGGARLVKILTSKKKGFLFTVSLILQKVGECVLPTHIHKAR